MLEIKSRSELETRKKLDNILIVDFYAVWCGPCKMLAPLLDNMLHEYSGDVNIIKVNVDDNPEIAQEFGVMSVPTLKIFHKGEIVETLTGFKPRHILNSTVAKYLNLH